MKLSKALPADVATIARPRAKQLSFGKIDGKHTHHLAIDFELSSYNHILTDGSGLMVAVAAFVRQIEVVATAPKVCQALLNAAINLRQDLQLLLACFL